MATRHNVGVMALEYMGEEPYTLNAQPVDVFEPVLCKKGDVLVVPKLYGRDLVKKPFFVEHSRKKRGAKP